MERNKVYLAGLFHESFNFKIVESDPIGRDDAQKLQGDEEYKKTIPELPIEDILGHFFLFWSDAEVDEFGYFVMYAEQILEEGFSDLDDDHLAALTLALQHVYAGDITYEDFYIRISNNDDKVLLDGWITDIAAQYNLHC